MPRRAKPAPGARATVGLAKGQAPPEAKHLAIRDENSARAWLATRDEDLAVYVRALNAVRTILEHAKAAAPLAKDKKKVEAQVAKLKNTYPAFEITVRAPPWPPFDATSLAERIAGESPRATGPEQVVQLSEFLSKLYVEQCSERFVVRWRPPTKPRGNDGIYSSAGRFLEDQLARIVMIGVATIFDLRSLERNELPIVAVASRFETTPKTIPDARLPVTFEHRADKWRQESDVVSRRLLTMLPYRLVKRIKPLVRTNDEPNPRRPT